MNESCFGQNDQRGRIKRSMHFSNMYRLSLSDIEENNNEHRKYSL